MNPTRIILLLFAGFFCSLALTVPLMHVLSIGQDPAGRGMIRGLVGIFFPSGMAILLGIPAVCLAGKHKLTVPKLLRVAAWILILLPALVVLGFVSLALLEVVYGLWTR